MDSINKYNNSKVLSTGEWVITKVLILIPIVNIILLFIWSFSKNENINKSNWAKATLIIYLLRLCLYLIILFIILSIFMSPFKEEYITF
jgi:hypothetical protein